jgi:uncharacterized protein YfeS
VTDNQTEGGLVNSLLLQRLAQMNSTFDTAFAKMDKLNDEMTKHEIILAKYNGLTEKTGQAIVAATDAMTVATNVKDTLTKCQAVCANKEKEDDKIERTAEQKKSDRINYASTIISILALLILMYNALASHPIIHP